MVKPSVEANIEKLRWINVKVTLSHPWKGRLVALVIFGILLETTPDGSLRGRGKASSGGKYRKQGLDVKVTPSHPSRGTLWRCILHINKW